MGLHWTLIRSTATGMALTPFDRGLTFGSHGASAASRIGGRIVGMPVRELAECVKSWDFFEAALGLAAINSVVNSPDQVEKLCGLPLANLEQVSGFEYYAERLRGQKVAVVGRFPDLDTLDKICRLTVLERRPGPGDLPDSACEYVLPEQDCVFLTATTLINKTLPRLLELSRNAFTVLVGPSTPLTPLLFEHGIDALAGTVVVDPESVWQVAQEGAAREVFNHGAQMVKVSKERWQKTPR